MNKGMINFYVLQEERPQEWNSKDGMIGRDSKYIILSSSDGPKFVIKREVAKLSPHILNFLENPGISIIISTSLSQIKVPILFIHWQNLSKYPLNLVEINITTQFVYEFLQDELICEMAS